MNNPYRDKIAIVTGASSGIGSAIALQLAAQGARLALVARDEASLASVARKCLASGAAAAEGFPHDLTDVEGIRELIGRIEEALGGAADLLVHSAGVTASGFLEDLPLETVHECFEVNVISAIALAQAVLPGMKAQGGGHAAFLLSGMAHRGVPIESVYCASKAALLRIVEALQAEWHNYGIRVTAIVPGPVDTRMFRSPRCFGRAPLSPRPANPASPEVVAAKIVHRLGKGATKIELPWRGALVRHLNYWVPGLLGRLLVRYGPPAA